MAQPSLKADFFVAPNGAVIGRAPALKRSECWRFYQASDKHCTLCGEPVRFGGKYYPFDKVKPGHIDHIFARSRGGQNDWVNLQLLCVSCNASKGAW